jgi:hypothetical protein
VVKRMTKFGQLSCFVPNCDHYEKRKIKTRAKPNALHWCTLINDRCGMFAYPFTASPNWRPMCWGEGKPGGIRRNDRAQPGGS